MEMEELEEEEEAEEIAEVAAEPSTTIVWSQRKRSAWKLMTQSDIKRWMASCDIGRTREGVLYCVKGGRLGLLPWMRWAVLN